MSLNVSRTWIIIDRDWLRYSQRMWGSQCAQVSTVKTQKSSNLPKRNGRISLHNEKWKSWREKMPKFSRKLLKPARSTLRQETRSWLPSRRMKIAQEVCGTRWLEQMSENNPRSRWITNESQWNSLRNAQLTSYCVSKKITRYIVIVSVESQKWQSSTSARTSL